MYLLAECIVILGFTGKFYQNLDTVAETLELSPPRKETVGSILRPTDYDLWSLHVPWVLWLPPTPKDMHVLGDLVNLLLSLANKCQVNDCLFVSVSARD